jgi:hypothetical protein
LAAPEPGNGFELVSFVAEAVDGDGITLRWNTGNEPVGSTFTVERSSDRFVWQQVFTQQGEGSGNGYKSYEVTDFSPIPGVSYYRLVCIHQGDVLETSDDFAVDYKAEPAIWFRSEAANGSFRVHGDGAISEVQVLNNRGQFIPMELQYDSDGVIVNAQSLEPGTYFVHAVVNGMPVLRPLTVTPTGVIGG